MRADTKYIFRPPPKGYAYWRVADPYKLYISRKVLKKLRTSWGLELSPTPWAGVAGPKRAQKCQNLHFLYLQLLAYWGVVDPHKLYISGKVLKRKVE